MTIKKTLPNCLVWGCILVLCLSAMQFTQAVTATVTPTSTTSFSPKLNSTSPSQNTSTPSLVTASSSGADSPKSTSSSQPSESSAALPSSQTTANPTTTTLTNNGSATVPQINPSPTVKSGNTSTAYSTSTTLIQSDTTSRVISTSATLSPSTSLKVSSTSASKISSSFSPISTAASTTNVTKSTAVPTAVLSTSSTTISTSSLKPSSTIAVTSAATSVVKPSATSGTIPVNSTTSTMNVISSQPSSTVVPLITSSAVTVSSSVSPSSKPQTPSTAPGPTASAAPNTTVATSSASTTESTPTTTNVTVVTTTSVSPPSIKQMVYINEVLVDKKGTIQQIELKLSNDVNMTKFAMMMIDGAGNQYTTRIYLKDNTKQYNNFTIVSFNLTGPSMTSQGVGIAVYETDLVLGGLNGTAGKEGLVDALVLGKTYEETSNTLLQVLTPGAYPFIINPSLYGQDKSISRCSSDTVRDSSMFALINPSMGLNNIKQCQERLVYKNAFSLKLHADCGLLNYPNGTQDSGKVALFLRYLCKEVNRKCQCGITKMHIADSPVIKCCGALNLNMNFLAPNQEQEDMFQTSYLAFLQETSQVEFDSNNYTIDSTCSSYCCAGPPSASKNNQVKVTVGVVVTCLIVFLIIVTILVMYMRRKKSAVYQFRMSRLTEEEDDYLQGPHCDDFVGGQDATFDLNR